MIKNAIQSTICALAAVSAVRPAAAAIGHPYFPDDNTLVLYHFDETKGDTAAGNAILNYGAAGGVFGSANSLNLTSTGGPTGRGTNTAGGYAGPAFTNFAASFNALASGNGAYQPAIPGINLSTNLKLYYAMDETSGTTIADTAGVANIGTKSASNVSIVTGRFGKALKFTEAGASSGSVAIDVSGSAGTDLDVGSKMTFSAWVQLQKLPSAYVPTDQNGSIFNSSTDGYVLYVESATGRLVFKTSSVANGSTIAQTDATNNGIVANQWFNVIGTYDGTATPGVTKLYINGVIICTVSGGGGVLQTQVPKIGYDSSGLNGSVDDLAVWNRVLTADEIAAIASGRPVSMSTPSPSAGGGARTAKGIRQSALQSSTGAFTYEALIKVSTLGGVTTNIKDQMIASHDGDSTSHILTDRGWQLKIQNNATTGGPVLAFFNGNNANLATITAPIPMTGTNAWDPASWYHVAVTFSGTLGQSGNIKMYWTKMLSTQTTANPLTVSAFLTAGQSVGSSGVNDVDVPADPTAPVPGGTNLLTCGGDSRGINRYELMGSIDEVRISDKARDPSDFLFHP